MTPIVILFVATILFVLWYAARKFFEWLDCPDSVERAVRQRREQAVRRDLYTKAHDVVFILGQVSSDDHHTCHFVYRDSVLEIHMESSEYDLSPVVVTFQGATVLKASDSCLGSNIDAYLPGEWEQHLIRLYAQAKDVKLKKEAARSAEEREQAIKNFGL